MTATTQQQKQTQFGSAGPQLQPRSSEPLAVSISRASLVGGCGLLLVLLSGLVLVSGVIPVWLGLALVLPAFGTVCFATGTLAVMLAGEQISTSRQGGEIGWQVGYWAGIFWTVAAMWLAAQGLLLNDFGAHLASQVVATKSTWFANYGLTATDIELASRVFGTLVVFGLIGSLVSALLSALGGLVYTKI